MAPRIVLGVLGVVWIGLGLAGLVAPAVVVSGMGIELPTGDALTEIRAMYGGAQLGLAALLIYALRTPAASRVSLLAIALFIGGMAGGRAIGIVTDGAADPITFGALVAEIAIAGVAALSLRAATPLRAPVPAH